MWPVVIGESPAQAQEEPVIRQPTVEGDTMCERATATNRILCCVLGVLVLVLADSMRPADGDLEPTFSTEMTIESLASENDVSPRQLLNALSVHNTCAWELPQGVDLTYLPVDRDHWMAALETLHAERHSSRSALAYALMVVCVSAALLLILPRKVSRSARFLALVGTVLVFGVILGGLPNPMDAFVRFLKALAGHESNAVVIALGLLVFTALSLLGSKLVCGWVCPFGALQELLFALPLLKRKRDFKLPFMISIGCRILVLIAAIMFLFGLAVAPTELSIYEQADPFRLFSPAQMTGMIAGALMVILILSSVLFRPFCQILCPFGIYSWLLENVAANRPRLDQSRCTKCEKCVKACPTQAMQGVHAGGSEFFRPGCWACGACVSACPEDAVAFTLDSSSTDGSAKREVEERADQTEK